MSFWEGSCPPERFSDVTDTLLGALWCPFLIACPFRVAWNMFLVESLSALLDVLCGALCGISRIGGYRCSNADCVR